ncbi:MAG: ABC transporter ATP-binding protein [Anaerolineae bacterium]|nr:ABC transporter ATP-binding protein [Anaerolineae bacterium]
MSTSLQTYRSLLVKHLNPERSRVALLGLLLLVTTGLQLLNPQIMRYFIDTVTTGGPSEALTLAAVAFMVVAIVNQALSVGATYVGENVGWLATNRLREDLAEHCLNLDMAFHNTRTPGEFIERLDGDVNALAQFFSQFLLKLLNSGLILLGVLVLMWREDWRVGLALSLFTAFAFWVLNRVRDVTVPLMTAAREATAQLFGFLEERLAGMEDLRTNGGQNYVMRRLAERMRTLFRQNWRAEMLGISVWTLTTMLFAVGYVDALAMGAYLFQAGVVTIGTVYLFFQYTDMLRRPLEQIATQMKEYQRASASVARITELATMERTVLDGPGAVIPAGPLAVDFDHVSFAYDAEGKVVHDLTFSVGPGEVLGLLGRTGSGKTTLTRLIFRLYDIQAGSIRLGGVDVREARLADLRRRVGMVTQDVQLFQASVRDNLTFFDPTISDDAILDVLDDLGLRPWLAQLPNGLDTELAAGGGGLSAGEAQLLAFARVFLQDPGLVILDEASSRLDPATEALIERAVDKLLAGRTGIIIAHRLGTVQRADDILILEAGRLREYGSRVALASDRRSRFSELLRVGLEEVLV